MKATKLNLVILLLLLFPFLAAAQDAVKSEKASILINNLPEEENTMPADLIPPTITIISPEAGEGGKILSDQRELSLLIQASDESGISYVAVDSKLQEVTKAGMVSFDLELNEGSNEVILVAVDSMNNMERMSVNVEYVPTTLTLAEKILNDSKYYGLIIGVNDYDDPAIIDLDNPISDARKLHELLVTEYTFQEENMRFLENATREDIIRAFDELSRVMTSNDNLLIFYAGHGWWDKNSNIGYWLPADARQDVKIDWFRNSTLVDYIKEVQSKHTLLITDACFGGAIFKTRRAFNEAPKAVEMLYNLSSRKAMTSGTLTEVPDVSAFTKYLVERLDDNDEQYLSSEQLFSSFRMAVINNSDVIPQYGEIRNVGDQGGDFIFIKNNPRNKRK